MSMRRLASVAAAVCLTMTVAYAQQGTASPKPAPSTGPTAATLTGTWTGTFKDVSSGSNHDETAMVVLKQEGDTVTGTAGPNAERQMAISKGKVLASKDGTAVTFEVANDAMVMQIELKLVDGHLKGAAKAERDGQKLAAELDLTRMK